MEILYILSKKVPSKGISSLIMFWFMAFTALFLFLFQIYLKNVYK